MTIVMALHVCLRVSAFGLGLLNASCARYYGRCTTPAEYYLHSMGANPVHMWDREKAWLRAGSEARLTVFS